MGLDLVALGTLVFYYVAAALMFSTTLVFYLLGSLTMFAIWTFAVARTVRVLILGGDTGGRLLSRRR